MAVGVAGGVAENAIADKVVNKAVEKSGGLLSKKGFGVASRVGSNLPNIGGIAQTHANQQTEVIRRAINANKNFKIAKRADKIGTGIAVAGGALLAANAIKNKAKAKKENKQ